jgi:hypothetical protein
MGKPPVKIFCSGRNFKYIKGQQAIEPWRRKRAGGSLDEGA